MKSVSHPMLDLSIQFNPEDHSYIDSNGIGYISATTFVKSFFEPFDEKDALSRTSVKTGILEMELLSEWREKRESASEHGNMVHAFAEATIMGLSVPTPSTDDDRRSCAILGEAINELENTYDFVSAEQIVFDPRIGVAGTVDLIAFNRKTSKLAILDWKTCESITNDSFGKRGLPPIEHVPDSKVSHYALQLSLYAHILASQSSLYPTKGCQIELALIHIPPVGDEPVWRPMREMDREISMMLDFASQRNRAQGSA